MSKRSFSFFSAVRNGIKKAYKAVDEVFESAERHHVFLLASGIAFNIVLFILPTVLVMIFLVNSFLDGKVIMDALETLLRQTLPRDRASQALLKMATQELQIAFQNAPTFGWIGIPVLLWISSTLFSSLRTGLNSIFGIPQPGFFLKYIFKDIVILLIFTVVVALSSTTSTLFTVVSAVNIDFLPETARTWLSDTMAFGISVSISFMFFLFLYSLMPNKRLPNFVLLTSTILSTVLWEAAKFAFAWWASNISSYGKIYGAYAVVALSALWLYYSSLILLLSGEIAMYWHKTRQPHIHSHATITTIPTTLPHEPAKKQKRS